MLILLGIAVERLVVFEPARALGLAQQLVDRHLGRGQFLPVDPVRVWWRDGFENGRRCWVADEEHGRAGVWFRGIVGGKA